MSFYDFHIAIPNKKDTPVFNTVLYLKHVEQLTNLVTCIQRPFVRHGAFFCNEVNLKIKICFYLFPYCFDTLVAHIF